MPKFKITTFQGLRLVVEETKPDVFLAKALFKDEEMYFGVGKTLDEAMNKAKENILSLQQVFS